MDGAGCLCERSNMEEFTGKVVVLSGATEGIGRALALLFARQQASLVLAARNADRLAAIAAECRESGADVLTVSTDVGNERECRSLVEASLERFGTIDVLVANAGSTMWSRLDELRDVALLERLMRVNYLGAAWLTLYALPALKASRGRIVAVSSLAGLAGVPTRTGYAASKHAMIGFFDSLRIELAGHGVSVTVIAPDFVVSQIHRRAAGPDGRPLGKNPMEGRRIMSAEECARIVLRATARRERLAVTSARGHLIRWMKLLAPGLLDRLAARAVRVDP